MGIDVKLAEKLAKLIVQPQTGENALFLFQLARIARQFLRVEGEALKVLFPFFFALIDGGQVPLIFFAYLASLPDRVHIFLPSAQKRGDFNYIRLYLPSRRLFPQAALFQILRYPSFIQPLTLISFPKAQQMSAGATKKSSAIASQNFHCSMPP